MPIQQMLLGAGAAGTVTGQVEWDDDSSVDYTTTWTVPTGVEKISVLCIGRGGESANNYYGGGGGGLTYANNISVTEGETLNIRISGGHSTSATVDSAARWTWGSRLYKGSLASPTWAVIAYGGNVATGKGGTTSGSPSTSTNSYTGGNGGGDTISNWIGSSYAGAGGAAGYAGNGGNGESVNSGGITSGAGGGGGGGAAYYASGSVVDVGAGGGVGRYGQGSNGAGASGGGGGNNGLCGVGGSSGTPASSTVTGTPGVYGGGSGMVSQSSDAGSKGGKGIVRILYPGDERSYPSTQTGNL
tara:strand:- start:582 stop:1484 length:903 start_codon:yes stop_codon:yes gene_type:complete